MARPSWASLRPGLGGGVDVLLRPIEPSAHLPHPRGTFLVMGAASDRLIARVAAERLAALTPPPRTNLRVEGITWGSAPKRGSSSRTSWT